MIKATFSNGTLVLGLSAQNIKRLIDGTPIVFDARSMGYAGEIFIIYGTTELEILHDLQTAYPDSFPEITPS